jgi:hypothetical protein
MHIYKVRQLRFISHATRIPIKDAAHSDPSSRYLSTLGVASPIENAFLAAQGGPQYCSMERSSGGSPDNKVTKDC